MDNFDNEFWNALDELIHLSNITIDRPKGSPHPKYTGFLYPVDYGYLDGTVSMDGEGMDVWVGSAGKAADSILCTVDLLKRDSEIKVLLGCTEREKADILEVHNRTPYMKAILIRR